MSSVSSSSALEILARSAESQKSGPIGLAVILVLCVASYFLFKSMSKHLKKVREEFPESPADEAPAASPSGTPAVVVPTNIAQAARSAAAAEAAQTADETAQSPE